MLSSSSSRHFPAGSWTNTNWISLGPLAGYQHTSLTTFTWSFFFSPLGNRSTTFFTWPCWGSLNICVGLGNGAPFLRLPSWSAGNGRVRLDGKKEG